MERRHNSKRECESCSRVGCAFLCLNVILHATLGFSQEPLAVRETPACLTASLERSKNDGLNLYVKLLARSAIYIKTSKGSGGTTFNLDVHLRNADRQIISTERMRVATVADSTPGRLDLLPNHLIFSSTRLSKEMIKSLLSDERNSLQVQAGTGEIQYQFISDPISAVSNVLSAGDLQSRGVDNKVALIQRNIGALRVTVTTGDFDSEGSVSATVLFANRCDADLWVYNPFHNESLGYPSYRVTIQHVGGHEIWDSEKQVIVGSQVPPGEKNWVRFQPRACVGRIFRVSRKVIRQNMDYLPVLKRNDRFVFAIYLNDRLLAPMPDFKTFGTTEGSLRWWGRNYGHEESPPAESNTFQLSP